MAEAERDPKDEPTQSKARKNKRSKGKGKAPARRRSFGIIPQFATRTLSLVGILTVALMLGRLFIVRR